MESKLTQHLNIRGWKRGGEKLYTSLNISKSSLWISTRFVVHQNPMW